MATKVVVEGSNISASQLQDLFRQFADGSLKDYHLKAFLDHRNPFAIEEVVINWVAVYELLGMRNELKASDNIRVNPDPMFWDVYVLRGVTLSMVLQAFRNLGAGVSLHVDDLDENVLMDDRHPTGGSYRVRFQKTIEADPELHSLSSAMLSERGILGITLLERLLLGLGYFLATGKHLDVENVTLCAGTHLPNNCVPTVIWMTKTRNVVISICPQSHFHPRLRTRAAVL